MRCSSTESNRWLPGNGTRILEITAKAWWIAPLGHARCVKLVTPRSVHAAYCPVFDRAGGARLRKLSPGTSFRGNSLLIAGRTVQQQ